MTEGTEARRVIESGRIARAGTGKKRGMGRGDGRARRKRHDGVTRLSQEQGQMDRDRDSLKGDNW